jgi:hypothetical protein
MEIKLLFGNKYVVTTLVSVAMWFILDTYFVVSMHAHVRLP